MLRAMSKAPRFTESSIPDLAGRTILVTGANSGIGFEAARMLAARGAHVVLACRDASKADDARRRIRDAHAAASVERLELDLASLKSVRAAAEAFRAGHERLDVLVNNAGVMALPFRRTADGFEMQLGTNHLGHFALTGRLIDRLTATPGSRVVNVSSGAHHFGRIDFEHWNDESRYRRWPAYGQSKLANLLFTFELARRLDAAGSGCISVAAHPGAASTGLPMVAPAMEGKRVLTFLTRVGTPLVTQSAAQGALPTVRAAVDPEARSGDYYGPTGPLEMRGYPEKVRSSRRSRDPELAARLWALSTDLTGVEYDALAPVPSSGAA